MGYELHEGDCLKIMPTLPAQSVDAIICDPPYGTTACAWDSVIPFAPMWECIKHVIKPRGAVVLFGSQPFTSALVMSNPKWFKYCWVWEKVRPIGHLVAKVRPMQKTEDIIVFGNGSIDYFPQMVRLVKASVEKYKANGRRGSSQHMGFRQGNDYEKVTNAKYPVNILKYSSIQDLHPTQKPVDLMAYLVKTYTNPGETVLDFTMGSGSTGAACLETGRNFIGIEKDGHYFDVASERLQTIHNRLHGLARKASDTHADLPLFLEPTP